MKLGSAQVVFNHLKSEKPATICTVAVKNSIYQGVANCSPQDNFCRETGRKVALTKALRKSGRTLTKKQRKNIWEDYRNMTKDPRW